MLESVGSFHQVIVSKIDQFLLEGHAIGLFSVIFVSLGVVLFVSGGDLDVPFLLVGFWGDGFSEMVCLSRLELTLSGRPPSGV